MMNSSLRKIVFTEDAAPPGGPYSQGVVAGNLLFLSGQIGRDTSGKLLDGIEAQTHQCLKNISAVVCASGENMSLANVVQMTVLLADINDWPKVNKVYETYFEGRFPARVAYAVKDLPMGALIEMEGIAIYGTVNDQ